MERIFDHRKFCERLCKFSSSSLFPNSTEWSKTSHLDVLFPKNNCQIHTNIFEKLENDYWNLIIGDRVFIHRLEPPYPSASGRFLCADNLDQKVLLQRVQFSQQAH